VRAPLAPAAADQGRRGRSIRRIVDLVAFAVVLASAAVVGRHDALSATMLQPIDDGFMKCCRSSDKKMYCCYWRGCEITAEGCKAAS
jgi:hypothetical protein